MGVKGLWRALKPAAIQVATSSQRFQGMVVAIDCGFIIHHYMHSKNRNIESVRALFLKKLLYILSFGIKPIFIFDGSPSELKHKVQKKRQDLKKIAEEKSLKANQELALQRAELQLLREIRNTSDSIDISNDEISVKKLKESNEDFIYPESSESSDHFGDDVEFIHHLNSLKQGNDELSIELLSRIDFTAEPFISLPLKFQHELVTYMKNCLYSLPLTLKDKSADDSGIKSDATNFSSSQLEKQIMHGKLRSLLLDIEKKIASQMLVDHSEQFIAFQNQIGNIETQRIASQENLHSIIIEISNKNVEDQKQSIDPMSNVKNEASNILQKSNEFNYGTETEFNKGDKYPITDKKASDCNISECKMISDSLEEIYDNAERFDASELSKKEENNYLYENRETESDHANTSNSVRLESVQKDTSLDISVSTDSNESFETVRNESDYGSKDESSKISSNSNNDIETESHEGLESIVNKSDNLDESRGQMVGLSLKDIDSQFFTSKSREDVTNGNMDDITEEKYAKRDDFEYLVDMSPTKQSKSVENYHILNIKQNHTLDSKKLPNIEFGSQINQSDIESIEKDNNIEQTVEMEESIPETSRYMRKVGLNSEIRSKEANLEDQINKTNELKKLVGFEYEDIYHAIKQLLITIGLPFVDGVHEAEAECAALEGLKICQATISDDSDTFLFGSKCVIRNFFDNKRNIEVYTLSNIKRLTSFNNQLDMIGFASLTGSDYFIGIYGIGRVTATQIIEVLPQDNFSSGKDFAQKIKDNLSIDHKLKQKIIDGFDFIDNDEIWQTYMNSLDKLRNKYQKNQFIWQLIDNQKFENLLSKLPLKENDIKTAKKEFEKIKIKLESKSSFIKLDRFLE